MEQKPDPGVESAPDPRHEAAIEWLTQVSGLEQADALLITTDTAVRVDDIWSEYRVAMVGLEEDEHQPLREAKDAETRALYGEDPNVIAKNQMLHGVWETIEQGGPDGEALKHELAIMYKNAWSQGMQAEGIMQAQVTALWSVYALAANLTEPAVKVPPPDEQAESNPGMADMFLAALTWEDAASQISPLGKNVADELRQGMNANPFLANNITFQTALMGSRYRSSVQSAAELAQQVTAMDALLRLGERSVETY